MQKDKIQKVVTKEFIVILEKNSMFNKLSIILGLIILLFSITSVYSNSLDCNYRMGSCNADETLLLYANSDLSSHVKSADLSRSPYQYSVCCSSPYTGLSFDTVSTSSSCGPNQQELLYYTSNTNARLALDYNSSHHTDKLCFQIPEEFSNLDLEIGNAERYQNAGYDCIFKISDERNSHISSCDATFNSGDQYQYSVWGRLVENQNTLVCNSDCTSRLDGRVYSACSSKIQSCSNVPIVCDGSLLGAWVSLGDGTGREIQCSPDWTNTRDEVFTEVELEVTSSSADCENIISTERTVLVDNEPVVMTIYVCS